MKEVCRKGFRVKEETNKSVNGREFWKHRVAVFPSIVEELMTAREQYKTQMFKCEKYSSKQNDF